MRQLLLFQGRFPGSTTVWIALVALAGGSLTLMQGYAAFNDELFDVMREAQEASSGDSNGEDSQASYGEDVFEDDHGPGQRGEEERLTHDGSVDPDEAPGVVPPRPLPGGVASNSVVAASTSSSRRRRRGSRGSGKSSQQETTKRWRSGQIPAAPVFDGDIEADPFCLRHYRRRLGRWIRITREFLPPGEQALRAREQLRGDAELELEETPDDRYDHADGVQRLLDDLAVSFGERELFRQGGIIREFEAIGRLQGESVTAFVRRFRQLERRLQDSHVPEYPEEARVIKLLDGLRLDERSTSSLLLAAGNKYNMRAVQDAIRIQYPAGMTVTGLPNRPGQSNRKSKQSSQSKRWSSWHAGADDGEDYEIDEGYYPEYAAIPEEYEAHEYDDAPAAEEDVEYEYDEEAATETGADSAAASSPQSSADVLLEVANALTVTSQRLAEITKARGYYNVKGGSGKSKGKSKSIKGKGKPKGKPSSKGNGKGSAAPASSAGKGRGAPGVTPSKTNLDLQKQRLADATCLGCGSPGHWLKDCPKQSRFSAQVASVGVVLDADGSAVSSSWMTSCDESDKKELVRYQLPALTKDLNEVINIGLDGTMIFHEQDLCQGVSSLPSISSTSSIPSNPRVLLQYANDNATLMTADTGCQRQVAGWDWHLKHQREVQPLQPLRCDEFCHFSFGPNEGVPSRDRFAYPAGLGGCFVALGISAVNCKAPALFSRPAFAKLGAIPDIVSCKMHYTALGTESQLFLSSCGHLAIRIDEWPSTPFSWPPELDFDMKRFPDAWSPSAAVLDEATLRPSLAPSRPPPHARQSQRSPDVGTMAQSAESSHGDRLHDGASSFALRCGEHETQDERPDSAALLRGSDSRGHVKQLHGFVNAERDPEVSQRSRSLRTSQRPESLRCRQDQDQDLRPVRFALGCPSRRTSTSSAQSKSHGEDASVRQGQERTGVFKRFSRKLGWILPTFLATSASLSSTGAIESSPVQVQIQTSANSNHQGPAFDGPDLQHAGQRDDRRASGAPSSTLGRADGAGPPGPRLRLGEPRSRCYGLAAGRRSVCAGLAQSGRAAAGGGGDLRSAGFSADQPMLKEDKGSFVMRAGLQKRLLCNVKQVLNTWNFENKAYDRGVQQVRAMRKFQHDVVEIFGGFANITAEALEQGLRALQPVDSIYGVSLVKASDYKKLCDLLRDRRPFLVVWEIRCDPWSNINHLNFSAEELEALRAEQYESLKGMCDTIIKLHEELGMHFLLENPWGTPFWDHPQITRLMNLPHVALRKGSMCRFGLRGKEGHLIRKHTGWLSDLSELLDELALECPGHGHQHEQCLVGNSKRAQVYTRQLARAVVKGLKRALARSGDERFIFPDAVRFSWTCGLSCTSPHHLADEAWTSHWSPAFYQAFYLDVDRTEESWRPILQEVENRLEGKVANSAIVKPGTAFYAQIQDLVPWSIHQVQICRTPKVRRTPHQLMLQKPVTHRAAVLRFDNGRLQVETEEAQHFSTTRFEAPVRFAVFIYGEAPQTSLNPEENAQNEGPEAARSSDSAAPKTLEPEEVLQRWQPGHRDITFEVQEGTVPRWVQNALRRLHVNLGHPSNESLTRHLAQAGASGQALLGAKHLQCKVCLRTRPPRQPRPAKAFQARRFNDRVFLDIIFVKNIEDTTFSYLNILDDASTYQSLATLPDRSEPTVVKVLVDGWLRYFGAPDHFGCQCGGSFARLSV